MRPAPLAVLLAILTLCSSSAAQDVSAITRPSGDVTLSFVKPGRIAEVLVKEGDVVKAAQVIVRQDDTAEQVELAQLKAQSEATVRIRYYAAVVDQKKNEYGKLLEAYEKKAVSKWDVERARLEVTSATLQQELAQFEHDQDGLKYRQRQAEVAQMRMASPIDGKVEKISLHPGEAANQNQDVIRIVKVDPLWIEVPVPLKIARGLKKEAPATVKFLDGVTQEAQGRIVLIAAVADAASDTLNVRVELPNAAGRPAGEHVTVRFQ